MSLMDFAAGEFFLRFYANGGKVIFYRSIWVAALIFVAGLGLRDWIDPTRIFKFDFVRLRELATEHFTWFGTIFAAAYAGFYARFSSQWAYLQGVYNAFMAAETRIESNNREAWKSLYKWQAGFIEDADTLHLARKPIFARLIQDLLNQNEIAKQFASGACGGQARMDRLKREVDAVVRKEESRLGRS